MAPRGAETHALPQDRWAGRISLPVVCAYQVAPRAAPHGAEPQGLNGSLLDLVPKEHRSGLVYRLRPEGAALSLWLSGGARFVAGFGLDILVG